ncbi:hypothetical protein TabM4_19995 (plasmid) [Tabrizicola sp. M-4]
MKFFIFLSTLTIMAGTGVCTRPTDIGFAPGAASFKVAARDMFIPTIQSA